MHTLLDKQTCPRSRKIQLKYVKMKTYSAWELSMCETLLILLYIFNIYVNEVLEYLVRCQKVECCLFASVSKHVRPFDVVFVSSANIRCGIEVFRSHKNTTCFLNVIDNFSSYFQYLMIGSWFYVHRPWSLSTWLTRWRIFRQMPAHYEMN